MVRHQRRKTMSVRPLTAMYLLLLCAVTTGCGTSAREAEAERVAAKQKAEVEKKAAQEIAAAERKPAEEKAADERQAAQEKAAADSYVKVKVEVELRGVLSCTEKVITISITEAVTNSITKPEFKESKW